MTTAKISTASWVAALAALCILSACATTQPLWAMSAQPALAQLSQPYLAQLRTVGIDSVTATGSGRFVGLATDAGPVYFGYPSDVPSTSFALRMTAQGLQAYSNDFDGSKLDQYQVALNSILTQAISRATSNNNWVAEESIKK
jgi:hypothetical protein